MYRTIRKVAMFLLAAVVALAGAGTVTAHAGADEEFTLRVMTFNIWVGGEQVSFDTVVEAIEEADADIVGIQEASGNLERLADELGWYHLPEHGRHQQIISRYPLVRGDHPDVYVYAMVGDAHVVAVSNVHLSAYPYGPYDLRDGAPVDEVLANEQRHLDELARHFEVLPALAADDIPVFFVGDLNVPSHLDWTQAAADASDDPFRSEIAWPVSVRLDELGFRDTFREIHPDEVAVPAYTWTPGYPPPEMVDDEVHDRIDYVYAAGPSTTVDSAVVGEDSELSQIVVEPWPSDHRAVVSEFDVVAKPIRDLAPTITTDSPVYDPGEPIAVDFLGAVDGGRITIDKPSSKAPERLARTDAQAGTLVFDGTEAGRRWPLTPGEYVVNLRSRGNVTASTSVVVRDASMLPSLELNANVYAAGDPITVTFANAAGNATDWIGLYRAGDTPGSVGSRYWQYVGGGQVPTAAVLDGSVAFSADEPGEGSASWPPDPGEYVAYLLEADGYRILAQAGFTVT
jgi:exonuclease III